MANPAKKEKWFVYILVDPRTDEVRYVGCTKDLSVRYACHLNSYKHRSYPVMLWIKELALVGLRPRIETVESGSGEWSAAEKKWIAHYRAAGCALTNVVDGGVNGCGKVLSQEFKDRLSEKFKGRQVPKEARAKMSESRKRFFANHPEFIEKLRNLSSGKTPTAETRAKLSEAMKGRVFTPEWKAKISAAKKGRGQPWSQLRRESYLRSKESE